MIENRIVREYETVRLPYGQYMELQLEKRKRTEKKEEPAIKPIDFIMGRHVNNAKR